MLSSFVVWTLKRLYCITPQFHELHLKFWTPLVTANESYEGIYTLFREPELPVPGTQPNRGGFDTARMESLDHSAEGDSEETPSLYGPM